MVRAAAEIRAVSCIELHTGAYAEDESHLRRRFSHAARLASRAWAGGARRSRSDRGRTPGAIAAIPEIEELSIGHSIVARALQLGMEGAVREMIRDAIGA